VLDRRSVLKVTLAVLALALASCGDFVIEPPIDVADPYARMGGPGDR